MKQKGSSHYKPVLELYFYLSNTSDTNSSYTSIFLIWTNYTFLLIIAHTNSRSFPVVRS